jgi:2-keto-4-pentenoate hydratase
MATLDPRQKAERIAELIRSRRATEVLPAELRPGSLEEAYAVRRAYQELEEARGRGAVAGWKIGLTTPVMQKLCGVEEPCYGAIFASEVHHCSASLAARDYCRLGVETEIAFQLGRDLPTGAAANAIAAAVDSAMAAIELIEDLRADYRRLDVASMVAGNVWNAGAVLGPPMPDWRRLDLARVAARLSINGREVGSGCGGDVMGHPLNALAWLADKLAAAGTPLKRGMIVLTGSMVPIQYPAAGDRLLVEISGLGAVDLTVT